MSNNKTYVIMKNSVKIKTTKSFNNAKAVAEAEQAEVFCNGEKVYSAAVNTPIPAPSNEQKQLLTSPVSPVYDEKVEEQKQPEAYRLKALMNVRKEPSLTAKVLAHAEAGKVVNVHEIKDNWMKVNWYDGFAYILLRNEKEEFAEPAKG